MDHRDRIDRFVGEVTDEVRYVSEDSDADFLLFNDQATDIVDEIHEEPILPNDTLLPVILVPTTRTSMSSSATQHRPTRSISFHRERSLELDR